MTNVMTIQEVQARQDELKGQIAYWYNEKNAILDRRYDMTYKGDVFKNADAIQAKLVELQEEFDQLLDREFELLIL